MWKYALKIGVLFIAVPLSPVRADLTASQSLKQCFADAGLHFGVAPELLEGIAKTESNFNPTAVNWNRDGSWDLGLMQINSQWLPTLRQNGVDPSVLYDPCSSVWIGAWILAGSVSRMGYTWEAVGAYNAGERRGDGHSERRASYARKVSEGIAELSGSPAAHFGAVRRLRARTGPRSGIAEFTFGPAPERRADASDDRR